MWPSYKALHVRLIYTQYHNLLSGVYFVNNQIVGIKVKKPYIIYANTKMLYIATAIHLCWVACMFVF